VKRFIRIDSGISTALAARCFAGQDRSSDRSAQLPGAAFIIYGPSISGAKKPLDLPPEVPPGWSATRELYMKQHPRQLFLEV
jgi:hypothetical protein